MLLYDIEILRSPKFDPKRPQYQYAAGWDDHLGMGITCIGYYNYATGDMGCYNWDAGSNVSRQAIKDMFESADMVVGFNNHKFDDVMMNAHGIKIVSHKSYDILVNVYNAAGLSGSWDYKTHGGYSLDAMCKANGLEGKTGNGADAPFEWQDGLHQIVCDYCMNDVMITKALMDKIFQDGGLINPKTGKFIRMAMPYIY